MKTKRMKKLMMAEGLSRNQVNRMVREQRTDGSPKVSNALYFHVIKKNVKLFVSHGMLRYISSLVLKDKEPEDGQEEHGGTGGTIPEEG